MATTITDGIQGTKSMVYFYYTECILHLYIISNSFIILSKGGFGYVQSYKNAYNGGKVLVYTTFQKPSVEEPIPKYNDSKTVSLKKQFELTYEDISNKSMDSYLEVPVSYKHVAKNSRGQLYESKLDTLIKRTKEVS